MQTIRMKRLRFTDPRVWSVIFKLNSLEPATNVLTLQYTIGADENPGPVRWTRPYFDCGRSNKWLVAAVTPIADIYPRHTGFRHIEYPTYTAAVVLELDFDRIDINQCPKGLGNNGKNRFADTARCKKETTEVWWCLLDSFSLTSSFVTNVFSFHSVSHCTVGDFVEVVINVAVTPDIVCQM